jgi:outer membrane protein W
MRSRDNSARVSPAGLPAIAAETRPAGAGASRHVSNSGGNMLRKSFWIAALGLLLVPAAAAQAAHDDDTWGNLHAGTWELTLTGSGASNQDFDSGGFGVQASLGYFILDQLELQGRQVISYADTDNVAGGGTNVALSSAVAIDYHFDLDRFQPFVGVGVGYNYGKNVNDTGFIGPEAGLKYFVKDDTFIYGLVQYQFFFNSGNDLTDNFDDGSFLYAIGIGFTW